MFMDNKVVPFAQSKGQLMETILNRSSCCKILGQVSLRLDSKTIESTFLPLAMSLCQDTSYEVRMCMCEQLNSISKSLG